MLKRKYVAGLRVVREISQVHERGREDEWTETYYMLENGALVAVTAKIGRNVVIGFGAVVEADCEIDDSVSIGYFCQIGDQVTIGAGAVIGNQTVIGHECDLGKNVRIGYDCYIGALNTLPDGAVIQSLWAIPHEVLLDDGDYARVARSHASSDLSGVIVDRKRTVLYT